MRVTTKCFKMSFAIDIWKVKRILHEDPFKEHQGRIKITNNRWQNYNATPCTTLDTHLFHTHTHTPPEIR